MMMVVIVMTRMRMIVIMIDDNCDDDDDDDSITYNNIPTYLEVFDQSKNFRYISLGPSSSYMPSLQGLPSAASKVLCLIPIIY
jgi:hypothetical protein